MVRPQAASRRRRPGLGVDGRGHRCRSRRRTIQLASPRPSRGCKPDVVLVAGLVDSGLGELVEPRSGPRSGRTFPLLATDGALPVSALFAAAGDAARGVRVAVPGIAFERVGATGERFASQFAATHGGRPPDFTALYAAAATEVLLAAIERSDGSRGAAARSLPGTSLADSMIGPVRDRRRAAMPSRPP